MVYPRVNIVSKKISAVQFKTTAASILFPGSKFNHLRIEKQYRSQEVSLGGQVPLAEKHPIFQHVNAPQTKIFT